MNDLELFDLENEWEIVYYCEMPFCSKPFKTSENEDGSPEEIYCDECLNAYCD